MLLCQLAVLGASIADAQLCPGSLGDNIFTDGNFGKVELANGSKETIKGDVTVLR
jgi:hypothetical protein